MNIHVILVRTEHSSNIGSVARAMANMGADRLILIDPKCQVDSMARVLAAGAQDPLNEVTIYPSWAAFYKTEGEGVRIAFSRRAGKKRKLRPLRGALDELKSETAGPLYLIF